MYCETANLHSDETHEQFVRRASRFFPEDRVREWSRIERAVFNHLMRRLIHEHSYGSITETMLTRCRDDMHEIVRRCQST